MTITKDEPTTAAATEVFEAFLFNPVEARREFNIKRTVCPAFHPGDWVLLANVPAAFSQEVAKRSRNFRSMVSIAETPSGAMYISIVNQVGSFQCRILMPLFEEKVAQMFKGSTPATLNVSLLCEGSSDANGFKASFSGDLRQTASRAVTRMNAGRKLDYLDEVEQTIAKYKRLNSLASLLAGEPVKHVCVVFAMPSWVVDFKGRFDEFMFANFRNY